MNTLVEEYKEIVKKLYGEKIADNLEVKFVDGWYEVIPKEQIEGAVAEFNQPAKYRKTQLQKTVLNLKTKLQQ
ncbi:MAG: hypothetical protein JNN15_00360 [Blastocatellia bacterium]|nr:hypothetical protein [Blastocatellia bacterium]